MKIKIIVAVFALLFVGCSPRREVFNNASRTPQAEKESRALASGIALAPIEFKSGEPGLGAPLMSAISGSFSLDALERAKNVVKIYESLQFEVVGFTDSSECNGVNCYTLSLRRADLVRSWLIAAGVREGNLLHAVGKGSEMPLDVSSTEEGRSLNRRVEINLVPQAEVAPTRHNPEDSIGTKVKYSTTTQLPSSSGSDVELLAVLFKEGRPRAGDSLFDSVTDVGYSKFALGHDAQIINRITKLKFYVVGASDAQECGSEGCDVLSRRRAQLVHEWLLANGVSSSAMETPIGIGSSRPLTDNSTEAAMTVNRRAAIEFVLPAQ